MVELDTEPKLCVINVYMPSRGNNKKEAFTAVLDELAEIVTKFTDTHAILLSGDLNSSISRYPPNERDQLLRNFVSENKLLSLQDGTPTYILPSGDPSAEIDYILMNNRAREMVTSVSLDTDHHLNTSDHTCLRATLDIEHTRSKVQTGDTTSKTPWKKIDKTKYKFCVEKRLSPNTNNTTENIESNITELTGALLAAAKETNPTSTKQIRRRNRQKPMSEEIRLAAKASKKAWWEWKKAGATKVSTDHNYKQMMTAKKVLRKAQRQHTSRIHREKMEKIAESCGNDQTFYKLVRQQRTTSATSTGILKINGAIIDSPEDILTAWATYFEKLATPKSDSSFNPEYLSDTQADVELIRRVALQEESAEIPISYKEVRDAISSLKNNKSPDIMGIMAEHLKFAGPLVIKEVQKIMNAIYHKASVPSMLKVGVLTPVYKKGPPEDPSNYRGISVTPIILKILEHIMRKRHQHLLLSTQSSLQTGFTKGTSSLTATFIVTECQIEAKLSKRPMYLTTLDTQKAFDVVNHDILLHKLYTDGIQGKDWLLIQSLYSDMTASVKWKGKLSNVVSIQQGVRQGGILSTDHYKRYNNPLLLLLEENFSGNHIGTTNIPHVTCADDIALLADSKDEMDQMLRLVESYSNDHRYKINPTKSALLCYHTSDQPILQLHQSTIPTLEETIHLGSNRISSGKVRIDRNVNLGRRTVYSLLGAGCHGRSGTSQPVKGHIWTTYVVPRFTYALETQNLTATDEIQLDKFQVNILKQIQHLPQRTSNTATLAFLGILPISVNIHKSLLNLIYNIITKDGSAEATIIARQLAVHDINSQSLVSKARRLLHIYDLPTLYTLQRDKPSRSIWKKLHNTAINSRITELWREDISSKSSLKYININNICAGKTHHVYTTVRPNLQDIQWAEVKVRLLTGTYTLQANRARFNQNEVDSTCKLCDKSPETREHFISSCKVIKHHRKAFNNKVSSLLQIPVDELEDLDQHTYTQLVLDSTHPDVPPGLRPTPEQLPHMELHSRELIYNLHKDRTNKLLTNHAR